MESGLGRRVAGRLSSGDSVVKGIGMNYRQRHNWEHDICILEQGHPGHAL